MTLSKEAKQRIEGLINQTEKTNLEDAISDIAEDLKSEGFDEADVKSYLKEQVDLIVLLTYL